MSRSQHFSLTTIVDRDTWASTGSAWLASAESTLRARAHERGLALDGEPQHTLEVLSGVGKVRITITARASPPQT